MTDEKKHNSLVNLIKNSSWIVVEIDVSGKDSPHGYIEEVSSEIERETHFKLSNYFINPRNNSMYHLHFVRDADKTRESGKNA